MVPELSRLFLKINTTLWMLKTFLRSWHNLFPYQKSFYFEAPGSGRYQIITSSEREDFCV